MQSERVEFFAKDKTQLIGTLFPGSEKGIILLHQYKRDRHSWDVFAAQLQQEGFTVLAIDLRGHGESQGKHEAFIDKNFQDMVQDAQAAARFLQNNDRKITAILGASIGANTAFNYSSDNQIPVVLLSPGLKYHGIDINDTSSRAPTLIVVATGDTYSFDSSKEILENNLLGEQQLITVDGSLHGTDMLPQAGEQILEFLKKL